MSLNVYRLVGARQAGYGIETDRELWFETLKESFGEYYLSDEVARARADVVATVSEDAPYAERWNLLARLEGIPFTFAEQEERLGLLDAEDDDD